MARILIIEDIADEREAMAELLTADSHQVVSAANGREALRILRERRVDVVVTDMIMPEMDGVETIMALREEFPGIKIIAISGDGVAGFNSYRRLARNLGVQAFMAKPFTPEEILRVVKGVLPRE